MKLHFSTLNPHHPKEISWKHININHLTIVTNLCKATQNLGEERDGLRWIFFFFFTFNINYVLVNLNKLNLIFIFLNERAKKEKVMDLFCPIIVAFFQRGSWYVYFTLLFDLMGESCRCLISISRWQRNFLKAFTKKKIGIRSHSPNVFTTFFFLTFFFFYLF